MLGYAMGVPPTSRTNLQARMLHRNVDAGGPPWTSTLAVAAEMERSKRGMDGWLSSLDMLMD